MFSERRVSDFGSLPDAVLYTFCLQFTPEETVLLVRTNKRFRKIVFSTDIWKRHYQRNFLYFDDYKALLLKFKVDWYAQFRNAYQKEYKGLSSRHRRLFSRVKNGASYISLKKEGITLDDFHILNAEKYDLIAIVAAMIAAQEEPSLRDETYKSLCDEIYNLAKESYFDKAKKQIDVRRRDRWGKTILYWALVCRQSQDEIACLLASGSHYDELFPETQAISALQITACLGFLKGAETLIQHCQPDRRLGLLNYTNNNGVTALMYAAQLNNDSFPLVQFFLKQSNNNNVNAVSRFNPRHFKFAPGKTALHYAAGSSDGASVTALLEAGATNTESLCSMGYYPIHFAAQNGRLASVKALLEKQPDSLNQKDKCNQTPLIWAASKDHLPVVQFLLEQKDVDLNAAASGFIRPLNHGNNRTALHWAAEKGHTQVAQALIDAGASLFVASGDMQLQPIHLAAREGHVDIVRALLEKQPDLLNQVDAGGQTPLMLAAARGHLPVVQFLLRQPDIEVNAESWGFRRRRWRNGQTALSWAARGGHTAVVEAFLDHTLPLTLRTPFYKSKKLDQQVAAKLELLEYIPKRRSQAPYKKSFTLWGHSFNFGVSREDKLKAAIALKAVVYGGVAPETLDVHARALNNGELGSICRRLRPQNPSV